MTSGLSYPVSYEKQKERKNIVFMFKPITYKLSWCIKTYNIKTLMTVGLWLVQISQSNVQLVILVACFLHIVFIHKPLVYDDSIIVVQWYPFLTSESDRQLSIDPYF